MTNLVWLTATFLGILPVTQHLVFGFQERRREILDYFDDKSIKLYFQRFFAAQASELSKNPREQLEKLYDQRFGRRTYVLPLLAYVTTLVASTAIIASVAIEPVWFIPAPDKIKLDTEFGKWLVFALAGAYLWVVYDLLNRLRQRDIVPSTLSGGAFRFLISVPVALALYNISPVNTAPAVAFLLGVFPTSTLMLILRRNLAKYLSLGDDAATEKSELEMIDGINTSIAEKFSEIGTTTILQLAYDDPIQLSMRLNLSFSYVLDLVSQALVAMYFSGSRYQDFRITSKHGLRGAIDVWGLTESLANAGTGDGKKRAREQAEAMISATSDGLHIDAKIIQYMIAQVEDDPATELLINLWIIPDEPAPSSPAETHSP